METGENMAKCDIVNSFTNGLTVSPELVTVLTVSSNPSMNIGAKQDRDRPSTEVRTAHEEGIPAASIQIYGDEWCIFGNIRLSNFMDNSLFLSERQVFGFPLVK